MHVSANGSANGFANGFREALRMVLRIANGVATGGSAREDCVIYNKDMTPACEPKLWKIWKLETWHKSSFAIFQK